MAQSFASLAARQLKTSQSKADGRVKLIRAVRAAVKAINLPDEDRKALQLELTGKASMADMNAGELARLLDHFNRGRERAPTTRPHIGKIRALWWTLYWLGELEEPKDTAINAFVARQTKVSALRFLDHRGGAKVIEALKAMAARAGVEWPSQSLLEEMTRDGRNPGLNMARLERYRVLKAIWAKLRDAGLVHGISHIEYVQNAHGLGINHFAWTEAELDLAIRTLGKKLRRAMNKTLRQAAED